MRLREVGITRAVVKKGRGNEATFNGHVLRVGDVSSSGTGLAPVSTANAQCGVKSVADSASPIHTFDCSGSPVSGRFVTLQSVDGEALRIAELNLYRAGSCLFLSLIVFCNASLVTDSQPFEMDLSLISHNIVPSSIRNGDTAANGPLNLFIPGKSLWTSTILMLYSRIKVSYFGFLLSRSPKGSVHQDRLCQDRRGAIS